MTQILTQSLIPIFVCLLLGYAAGWMKVVNNENRRELVKFLMSFALPCTLFVTTRRPPPECEYRRDLRSGLHRHVPGHGRAGSFFQKETAVESAVVALTQGFRSRGVGLPARRVYGVEQTFLSSWASRAGADDHFDHPRDSRKQLYGRRRSIARGDHPDRNLEGARKARVLAPMAGVVRVLRNFHLPMALEKGFAILGNATEGAAIFVTGLVVSAQKFRLFPDRDGPFDQGCSPALLRLESCRLGIPQD